MSQCSRVTHCCSCDVAVSESPVDCAVRLSGVGPTEIASFGWARAPAEVVCARNAVAGRVALVAPLTVYVCVWVQRASAYVRVHCACAKQDIHKVKTHQFDQS